MSRLIQRKVLMRNIQAGRFAVAIAFLSCAPFVHATSHYITPNGAGAQSGADWSNACVGFSHNCDTGTGMVRGDVYYIASGSYTTYEQLFNVADGAGSLTIEIRGATAADH